MSVIVHTSFSKVGQVEGDPAGIILTLEEIITLSGTAVMPIMTGSLTDPAEWH